MALRLFFLVILVWTLSSGAALANGGSTDEQIGDLETKFFEHEYKTDSEGDRLTRLEKLVFGEQRSGDDQKRLNDLLASVKDADAGNPQATADSSPASSTATTGSDNAASQQPQQATQPVQQLDNAADNSQEQSPGAVPDNDDYPRVTALENAILGQNFRGEPLTRRLDQLETKAYGKPSDLTDLSERTDNLENYVRTKLHMPKFGEVEQSPVAEDESPAGYPGQPGAQAGVAGPAVTISEPPPTAPIGDKLSWMELEVFGRTNGQATPIDRANRLEHDLFPQDERNSQAPLAQQVSMLVGAVELLQSERQGGASPGAQQYPPGTYPAPNGQYNTQAQTNQQQQQQQPAKKGHPLLKSIAHVLGEVGGLAAGALSSGMMYGGGGYGGYGGYPAGYNPYGYGYGGPGFSW